MKKQTFVIEIIETDYQSWQGSIEWIQGRDKKMFRSMMEMLRLMDSVVESENGEKRQKFSIENKGNGL